MAAKYLPSRCAEAPIELDMAAALLHLPCERNGALRMQSQYISNRPSPPFSSPRHCSQ